ncbi:uncharacterized protein N7506_009795 [Penicillium brevicompactum]|uniref:uncharacterized protein n=1 Tax=Penicillium brevicompactum TaxID=5074 RepID=UPI0025424143|nr:uncharacterized protein N7506_009795 [Penicillium brevicompactum]KAJ5326693.1 hypothetical protein N7506_009795 [Penicillium brevicompactum]
MEVRSNTSVNGSRSLAAEEMAQQDSREGCLDPVWTPLDHPSALTTHHFGRVLTDGIFPCQLITRALDMRDTPHL